MVLAREIISWDKTELRSVGRYSGRRECIRTRFDGVVSAVENRFLYERSNSRGAHGRPRRVFPPLRKTVFWAQHLDIEGIEFLWTTFELGPEEMWNTTGTESELRLNRTSSTGGEWGGNDVRNDQTL